LVSFLFMLYAKKTFRADMQISPSFSPTLHSLLSFCSIMESPSISYEMSG
jgi:hypothetical protein